MLQIQRTFPALVVDKDADGVARAELGNVQFDDMPPGEVVVEVAYASLNYKDALACQAHPGVVKSLPHVPGIDCAGRVVTSDGKGVKVGQDVLVTGYGLGSERWGGLAKYVRVPAEWIVPMPIGLDARTAMIHGTAGFTATQCVLALVEHGIEPDKGPIVVTGATGGVAMIGIGLLAKLGYNVTAVTGKAEQTDLLRKLGANDVAGRDLVGDTSDRPLLKSKWAGAIDTVGGAPLTAVVRATMHRGCVAACGLVAGEELPLTVHPFILRGVTLAGIDSAKCPHPRRLEIWDKLAGEWKIELPAECVNEVSLAEVPQVVEALLAGSHIGRTIVAL